ncbi:DegT/DnrJ/EryC1/StrS family aminotransferase, partial [Aquabacterium sp.]|uniref:DegT/DnrJ/EryC1/StrS family aminotransferase n=1 Tax=Aquabacterium sp. TaxID=1872578 RepID=UPI0025BEBD1C
MTMNFKNVGLIGLGMLAGAAGTMQLSAMAQKSNAGPLPLEELRQLSDVFGLIKSDYVEPIEDKKLLAEAISGMVASLDPHSAYLDKKAFRELQEGTQGKFVGLGIEVGMEDGYVKVVSPIEDSPAYRGGVKAGDEVITTPLTFCATVNAILHTGATPVLADVVPQTMNIDPCAIAGKIGPRTRALLPVHFAGLPCEMEQLLAL